MDMKLELKEHKLRQLYGEKGQWVTFKAPQILIDEIDQKCKTVGCSRSWMLRLAAHHFVKNYKKVLDEL